ncbi:MAG: penicillin-binding protein 2 [Thermoleophilaceae bacterium]|nr:penicillin-binding protein 2 [Thermoleophilaceae bacterium]
MTSNLVERRIGLLFALFLLALTAGVVRAAYLGTVKSEDLSSRAVTQQTEDLDVPARRGTIYDRVGNELAVSEDAVTVFANPFLIKDPGAVAGKLSPIMNMDPGELLELLSNREEGFVFLKRKIDPNAGERVKKLRIEGIGTQVEPRRTYPQKRMASQLIGSVGTDNLGLSGIEQQHEKRLHGTNGKRRIVKDALGKPIQIVDSESAAKGGDLTLTLDAAMQERTESVLAEVGRTYRPKGATAIVADPRSGEILALANWPRVDANRIEDAPAYARQNRAVSASYEPGSTFKAVTVSGALEEKLVTPDTPFTYGPTIQVADREIRESHEGEGGGTLTVAQILAQSSNVGTVKIGLELGKERFDKWVRRFGFGASTGIDIPGEAAGIVPKVEDYSGSSIGNLPIGQGLAVTPMQMLRAYGTIANGGIAAPLHVVKGRAAPGKRVMSADGASKVRKMLQGVLGAGGTAQKVNVPGYVLAGKTGTAEKPDGNGGYSKSRYVASFIGFAPAKKPRLLVSVMVDEPAGSIYGADVAAPAFQKIVSFALPYLRIPPR